MTKITIGPLPNESADPVLSRLTIPECSQNLETVREVNYAAANPWVRTLACESCHSKTKAWCSSGMSDNSPHFYCTRCSNVVLRRRDQEQLHRKGASEELLHQIAADLPSCPCGGCFAPGSNPKCPVCKCEFADERTPLSRLCDPHMIVVTGALIFGDDPKGSDAYRVRIDD
jgi:hypothetical protein